ncbi:MAG TPA: ATP-binding protein, partial [Blastocatellia bacterium]
QFTDLHPLLAEGLETVERNANQLSGLIKDLLDLTRIISRKIELVRGPTSLTELVQSVVTQVRSEAEARLISIQLSMPDHTVVNNVDPVRIRQVVSNLLDNAVKFTPAGGRIGVSLSCVQSEPGGEPSDAIIEVEDTGIGIDAEFLPHVFERFAQANGGINRRYGGLGLGLAITRAMVEMHGGQISAQSEGRGRGSRFTVRLPMSMSEAARDAFDSQEVMVEVQPERLNLCVVVIEDSRDTLNMLKLWLDDYGCKTFLATDATEGIRLVGESRPDLIISDIGLPGIDGYEFMRKLRQMPGFEYVPAIALTGYARNEDRELAMAAGYNAHIAKPAEVNQLLALMKTLTRKG